MKKFYLSAAVVAASLALPGLPALAQTNEITIGITVTTTGPAAALGIPERNALEFVAKEIGGAALRHRVQGRYHHGFVDDAADHRGVQRRQRGGYSPYQSGAVSDYPGACKMVGIDAAADPDHGQGRVRAHEGA